MTSTLRIDHAAKQAKWGRIEMTMSDIRRIDGGFRFEGTPEPFVPSRFEVYPDAGRFVCDGIEFRLIGWKVTGSVATAETEDASTRPDDGWADAYAERIGRRVRA